MDRQHPREEPPCCGVAAYGDEDVDHLAVLVDGPVYVAPDAGDFHVGLVDEPAVAGGVAARACCFNRQLGEVLHPPIQRDVIHHDAPLGQELLEIAVRQPETQIPADRQQDHLGREPIPSESRPSGLDREAVATKSHPTSLTPASPIGQCNRGPCSTQSRSTTRSTACPPSMRSTAGPRRPHPGLSTRSSWARTSCMVEFNRISKND